MNESKLRLTQRQSNLLGFVIEMHGDQRLKYTGEPYWTHPFNVATILQNTIAPYNDESLYKEVALCHDLLEDTDCDVNLLSEKLVSFRYGKIECLAITNAVRQLTDYYTHEKFPDLNRLERKRKEATRIGSCSGMLAQTVKLADIIDNTASIVEHDPKFAKTYLPEKKMLIDCLTKAHIDMKILVCVTYHEAVQKLNKK